MKNTSNTTTPEAQSTFPVPFTLEQLREDILKIYLLQLRTMYLFANDKKIWALAGKSGINDGDIWVGSYGPDAFNLTYEDIQDSNFAQALEQQYSFGFFGIDKNQCEPMHMETMHTWVAAYLRDLTLSAVVEEWGQNDADINTSRCIHVCELANARNVLEGGENFFPYMTGDENKTDEALTVRQMALLSGMEEMTIRTAISRKSVNQLQAFKDDRRTLISIKDAKAWLIAKGRYLLVSQTQTEAVLNLEKTSFKSIGDFVLAVSRRVVYLNESNPDSNLTNKFMAVAGHSDDSDQRSTRIKNKEDLLSSELMTKWANILQVPAELMILRAREAVLQDDLARVTSDLNAAVSKRVS